MVYGTVLSLNECQSLVTRGNERQSRRRCSKESPSRGRSRTYNLGFFLGPGFPLGLLTASVPSLAAAAERLTPFFLDPSADCPVLESTGVPSGAGVGAFDSEALSAFELDVVAGATGVLGEPFDSVASLGSDSASTGSGATILRSPPGETRSLTTKAGADPGLRGPSTALFAGAIAAKVQRGYGDGGSSREGFTDDGRSRW